MGNMKNEARPPRRLAYTWNCSKECESYSLSAVLSWRLLLYYAYADGPQITVSSHLLKKITNAYPVGPFAQYLREVLSVVSFNGTCGFSKHTKTRNSKAENGSIFDPRKKVRPQTFKRSWRKLTKKILTLKWRLLEGACRSLIPALNFYFSMRQKVLRHFCPEQGGGHTQREWWLRKISWRSSDGHITRRLHYPPAVDRTWNKLGYSIDGAGFRL